MTAIELLSAGSEPSDPQATPIWWPQAPGATDTLKSDLGWNLDSFGEAADAAVDLTRIAVAAYVIDRLARRPVHFSRDLRMIVHTRRPDLWRGEAGRTVVDILAWLTGDTWELTAVQANDQVGQLQVPVTRQDIMLLSGGLDSFCGAVDHAPTVSERMHVGHRDAAPVIRHAQNVTEAWLRETLPSFAWTRIQLTQAQDKREASTRTRSLLFMALAIAAASGTGAPAVTVPENGFTSVNLPLQPSRGGALSTKSTHPWTFHQIQRLVTATELDVTVGNPYQDLTKGELVQRAAARGLFGFREAAARTLSCSKLDSGRIRGGNPSLNCGLCLACLVRRGAFIAGGVPDDTAYLVNEVTGESRATLVNRRRDDLTAVREALATPVDEVDLIASAAWPSGTDLDQVIDLCERGREELRHVPLP